MSKINKKNKYNYNNIFFLIFIFLIFLTILSFNYLMDPYKIFNNKTRKMNNTEAFIDNSLPYIYMEAYKDVKTKNVIIGGSDAETLFFCRLNDYFYNGIYLKHKVLKIKNYYKVLKRYLELHTETEIVILVINYASFFSHNNDIPDYNHTKTLQDMLYPLFSIDASKESFNILKYKITSLFYKNEYKEKTNEVVTWFNPYNTPSYKFDKLQEKENNEDLLYFDKVINLLKEKNIKYYILIPPYNSMVLKIINSNERYANEINRIKRHMTYIASNIYDSAFINKHTKANLLQDNFLHIYGGDHPNYIFGIKFFKVFFDEKNADKDFYRILTKENIEEQLNRQNKEIKNYTQQTEKDYEKFFNLPEVRNHIIPPWTHVYEYTKNDLPKEYKKELDYMDNYIDKYKINNNLL